MARFHVSTNSPTKLELLTDWIPKQDWAPGGEDVLHQVGTFHFDDPEGEVGMQTHLLDSGGMLLQVPLTYRATPLAGGDDALVGQMHHAVLGPRFVYDALCDSRYLLMLAAVTLTGFGQALGMVQHGGRWAAWPSEVRLEGGGWGNERVVVDGFARNGGDLNVATFANEQFELGFHRRPQPGPRPPIGITATWPGSSEPVVLADIRAK